MNLRCIMNPPLDNYTKLLGVQIIELKPGFARVKANPNIDHCNFNGVIHGGYIFSIADIAFAYASNAGGQMALALDMYISFRKPAKPGMELEAVAQEVHRSGRTGLYQIKVASNGELVALIQATVYFVDRTPGGECN
jgi:acyl-CoA thioesterase